VARLVDANRIQKRLIDFKRNNHNRSEEKRRENTITITTAKTAAILATKKATLEHHR
jgi:thermostable 8-oxoguanine DNA glycosylase